MPVMGSSIPTLQEVLDLVDRQVPINIELKGIGTAKIGV
jgi:glycerophosphoryl diester phosphodiesterase